MATVENLTDEQVKALESPDFDVPCSWTTPCDRPAAWYFRCRVCGDVGAVCEEHRAQMEVENESGVRFFCTTTGKAGSLFFLGRFIRIGQGS